jgi:FkbM family methyltransferase
MRRFLKRRINRFLPDRLRSSIKRRFNAKFAEPVGVNVTVEREGDALRCTIADVCSFLAPLSCQAGLANFTDSPEGRAEFANIARAAQTGGALFDIGAHSGLISAIFCAANSMNKAFSFEPSPILTERLFSIRELNQFGERMRVEQIGIGESSKTVKMILDPAGGFIQPEHFDHTMWATPQAISVRMESIADTASRLAVIPQFIKIDIESYEFEAIKGATQFLSRHKPEIFLEVHLNYLEQRSLSAKALIGMLRQCGYDLYTLAGARLKASDVYDSPLPTVHVVAR